MILFNPKKYERWHADERSKEIVLKTIAFFEGKGLKKIKADDQAGIWYDDFLDFIRQERIFATLLTPAGYGSPESRWDMWRISEYNEVLAFYGLQYWYAWQVTILGLGPIWMGSNEAMKQTAARLLDEGGIFAFGLSEKEHGADLYATEMTLFPQEDGTFLARGEKYYIGNGNKAALVSTFGKVHGTGEYIFFAVKTDHPCYECVKKIDTSGMRQAYVAHYKLNDYPLTVEDILSRGPLAWESALNTVNIGKFELGFASIGVCTHALYEALDHTVRRVLYGRPMTDFLHVRTALTEACARLSAMKLCGLRVADYLRCASVDDRRYLLFNPIVKMKVTSQGKKVVDLLHEVIAAKGFEQSTYFETALRDIGMLPKLEGTEHVNQALIIKFISGYFFAHQDFPETPKRNDPSNDAHLFRLHTGELSKIKFPDYRKCYEGVNIPNVLVFREQVELFKDLLIKNPPTKKQAADIDYLFALGELFILIVYAQLILENVKIYKIDDDLVNEIFKFMIKDFDSSVLNMLVSFENTLDQEVLFMKMTKKPLLERLRFNRVWEKHVVALKDQYVMNE
ncbi:MAG: acyl-CoA dehydrogenase [Syntrophaceae bacterium]